MRRRLCHRIVTFAAAGALCALACGYGVASDHATLTMGEQGLAIPSDRFVVAEAFAAGRRIGGHAITTVGFNFQKYFFPLVEKDIVVAPPDPWTLGRSTDDATLIAMIGGEDRIVLPLPAIHRLISLGKRGDSHTDGRSNFAYARSPVDGRLWAIHWTMTAAGEWIVGAVFVPHPDIDWPAGSRLFAPSIVDDNGTKGRCVNARLACVLRP